MKPSAPGPTPRAKYLPLVEKVVVMLVTFGLAILGTRLLNADRMASIVLSLVAALAIDSVFTFIRLEHASGKLETLIASFGLELANREGRHQAHLEALALATHEIPAARMPSVWKRLTWTVSASYRATNYIDPGDIYGPQQAKDVFLIQEAKAVAEKIPFRKVLIVQSAAELGHPVNRQTLEHHRRANIDLRWILRDRLSAFAELREFNAAWLDFAVIDERIVLVWHLSPARTVTGGEVRFGREACQPFVDFFDALHNEASREFPAASP